jgi:hypothetical protein
VDRHGNPIFHAAGIMDTAIGSFEISIRYYTIYPNVIDRHSSAYISDKPAPEEIFQFALEKPVYNFVVHKNNVVSKIILFVKKTENGKTNWIYLVKNENQQTVEVESGIKGDLCEHRYLELTGEKGSSGLADLKNGKPVFLNFNRRIYGVIPFINILKDFQSNFDKF